MISSLVSMSSKLGISFLFRIVIPGIVLSLLLLPIVNPLVPPIIKIDKPTDLATILLPVSLILGIFTSLLQNPVYRIYEGRLLWLQWFHEKLRKRIEKRIKRRFEEQKPLAESSTRYKEIWYWLRMFPLDENGDPTARRPTRLGNILEGYEEYPQTRYGMDSVFYWYRLWPTLPEGFLRITDQIWAEADCLMYISFSGVVMSLLYAILAVARLINSWFVTNHRILFRISFFDLIPSVLKLWIGSMCCLIGGYLVYRISMPLHRRNGEYFKAAFDLYRNNIAKIAGFSPKLEKAKWRETWNYLQYVFIQCPRCKKHYFAQAEECPHCAKPCQVPFDS